MLVPLRPHFLLAVPHASLWHSFAQVTTKKPAHNGLRDSLWTSNANNVKKRRLFPPQCSGKSHVSRLENKCPCFAHFSLPLSHCCTNDWFGEFARFSCRCSSVYLCFSTHSRLMKGDKKGGGSSIRSATPTLPTLPFWFRPYIGIQQLNTFHPLPILPRT